jgi:hypothetical protein
MSAKDDPGFRAWIARTRRRLLTKYEYGRKHVPRSALAVVLERGKRWWWITQAMTQDAGAWRISYGDERGPAGHEVADFQGRPFQSKFDAILDVLTSNPSARITKYIMPGGQHVEVSKVRANPGRPERPPGRRRR